MLPTATPVMRAERRSMRVLPAGRRYFAFTGTISPLSVKCTIT